MYSSLKGSIASASKVSSRSGKTDYMEKFYIEQINNP